MNIDSGKLTGMLAASALSELGELAGGKVMPFCPGYLSLSVRFAYHFATIDSLCGDNDPKIYIPAVSGGAGDYYGRSLRIQLMGNILDRLGFRVTVKGDRLEAFIARYDKRSIEEKST